MTQAEARRRMILMGMYKDVPREEVKRVWREHREAKAATGVVYTEGPKPEGGS